FDSICMTILFFVCLAFYLTIIWFGVIHSNEGTNPIALLIISTIVFGIMITITIFLIIKYCYGYWILLDDSIICKKLFSKRRKMKLIEIKKVEKKTISAFVLGIYKSEAYIIYSSDKKIVILIGKRKKYFELDNVLTKFIHY
ncbi:hypothetical protein, partial [uncultured Thomasclavelia sp.]|uniref:hypothetical protein n=1 Tax=uncultured Thomasclavelia sp. TaxID=3025759 RepID=UPI00280BE2EF